MLADEVAQALSAAAHVVDMYDQANTNRAIERLGARGRLLDGAIEHLRDLLNVDQQRTILDAAQIQAIHPGSVDEH